MLNSLIVLGFLVMVVDIGRSVLTGKLSFNFSKRVGKFVLRWTGRLLVAVGNRLSRM